MLTALVAAGPSPATTTHPLVTDPEGDAGQISTCITDACVPLPGQYDPALDILAGDVNATTTTVAAAVTVKALSPPDPTRPPLEAASYLTVLATPDATIRIWVDRSTSTGALRPWATVEKASSTTPVPVDVTHMTASVEFATGIVSASVPLADLNAALAQTGAAPLGLGSTVGVAFQTMHSLNAADEQLVATAIGGDTAPHAQYVLGE